MKIERLIELLISRDKEALEKFTCIEKTILNKETITFFIAVIILLIIFIYNL